MNLNQLIKFVFAAIFCAASFGSIGQSFLHPGILNNKTELDFIKSKIKEGQEPWKSSFEKLKTSSYSSLDYNYQPFALVECGSYNKPNIGCNNIVDDGMAVYSMALMWYFTDNILYANKAIEIINAWSGIYEKNTNSNARLVVSWATPWYVNGAEILRYSNAGFKESEIAKFNTLIDKFLPYTLDETMPGNNWIQSAIEAHMAIAVFKDDWVLFNQAVDRWKFRVKTYIYQDTDGPKPVTMPYKTESQTESTWRSTATSTAYINGLTMETCRDLGHLNLGYNSMVYAAETAWKQGVDLFSPEKKRLSDFMELHGSWMTGAVAVPSTICDGKVIAAASDANGIKPPTGGGKTSWEIAYSHLHNRLGIDLPYTKQMILSTRPKNAAHWVSKWETLTHGSMLVADEVKNLAPLVTILNPTSENIDVYSGYSLEVKAQINDTNKNFLYATLYIDNDSIRAIDKEPFEWGSANSLFPGELNKLPKGSHIVKVVATGSNGTKGYDQFSFNIIGSETIKRSHRVFFDSFNRGKEESPLSNGGIPQMTYNTTSKCLPVVPGGGTSRIVSYDGVDYNLQLLAQHTGQTGNQTQVSASLKMFDQPFQHVLSANSAKVSWSFNLKCNRSSTGGTPGFKTSNQGVAVILAADGEDFNASNGYAVCLLKNATNYAVSLVKFKEGLSNLSSTLIGPTVELKANTNWTSVFVEYDPSTNNWSLFSRDDQSSAIKGDLTKEITKIGEKVDDEFTHTAMSHFGFLLNTPNAGSTGASGNAMTIDDFGVSVDEMANGISDHIDSYKNRVFPNPAKRMFFIETYYHDSAVYQMFNIYGQPILKGHFMDKTSVAVADLKPGYYFLMILTKRGVSNHKILIN